MRKLSVLFVLVGLSGCTFMNVHELDQAGHYELVVHGNAFHSKETLSKKIEEKAVTLCGEGQYEIIGPSNLKFNKIDYYSGGQWQSTSAKTLTQVVICEKQ